MPAPRLLVIEGNTPENRANHVAAGGTVARAGYAALLRELLPGAVVAISFPADPGANLPNRQALEGYEGGAITGSGLHVYEASPAVTNQIELARAALKSGTPVFGSCWGLQVLTVAAGRRGPQEPEGPRDRLRPAHQAHRARPQASDVRRQARGVQRADR